jgi:hypothetical protein
MKMIVFLVPLGIVAGAATIAKADDRGIRATATQVIGTDSLKRRIDQLGYDVLRLARDEGGFEARILDRASGGIVKAHFDAATGELLRASLAR